MGLFMRVFAYRGMNVSSAFRKPCNSMGVLLEAACSERAHIVLCQSIAVVLEREFTVCISSNVACLDSFRANLTFIEEVLRATVIH